MGWLPDRYFAAALSEQTREPKMFVPKNFALEDRNEIHEIMRGYAFALFVTAPEKLPTASHLPILYDPEAGPHGTLYAHMARANPQWHDFARLQASEGEALAIFQGPHAYVSPRDYGDHGPSVPTWNYLAVHAYGIPQVVQEHETVLNILRRMTADQEISRQQPWSPDLLPADYLDRMMRAIVTFAMPVSRLEAKAKLNQNKKPEQRFQAAEALAARDDIGARATAAAMRRLT
jgi:transcriptional regulator